MEKSTLFAEQTALVERAVEAVTEATNAINWTMEMTEAPPGWDFDRWVTACNRLDAAIELYRVTYGEWVANSQ